MEIVKLYKVTFEHKGTCYVISKSLTNIEKKYPLDQILDAACLASTEKQSSFYPLMMQNVKICSDAPIQKDPETDK